MINRIRCSTRLELEALEERQLLSTVPILHSNPGAAHSLYLDFDGHFESAWNREEGEQNGMSVVVPGYHDVDVEAFSMDADLNSFSSREQDFIREVWQRVAEDYAPFNVDVTTEKPASLYASGNPTGNALRVAIGEVLDPCSCLGFAFTGTPNQYQDAAVPNTVFVYAQKLNSAADVAATASHEAGHAYGLNHIIETQDIRDDSRFRGRAPIMTEGLSQTNTRDVWYQAPIVGTMTQQDPVAHLTSVLGARADDHGDDITSATPLSQVANFETNIGTSGNRLYGTGVIENFDDMDYFVLPVIGTGPIMIRVNIGLHENVDAATAQQGLTLAPGYNLDSKLVIRDSQGNLIAEQDLYLAETFSTQAVQLHDILGNGANMVAGETYYVGVGSHGRYGDLGNYLITVDGPVAFGPRVKSAMAGTPMTNMSSPHLYGVDRVWIEFDQPIDVSTFTADDVALQVPWSLSKVKPTAINVMDANDPRGFELVFPLHTSPGLYRLTVGPNIRGIYGVSNPYLNFNYGLTMDQDRDGVGGEANDDKFVYAFEVRDGWHDFVDDRDLRWLRDHHDIPDFDPMDLEKQPLLQIDAMLQEPAVSKDDKMVASSMYFTKSELISQSIIDEDFTKDSVMKDPLS